MAGFAPHFMGVREMAAGAATGRLGRARHVAVPGTHGPAWPQWCELGVDTTPPPPPMVAGCWEPLIDPVVENLTVEVKLALHEAGPGAPLGRLLEALAAAAATALRAERLGEIGGGLASDLLGAYGPAAGVLSVDPHRACGLAGAWNLADHFRAELAGVVEVVAHQFTHAWQTALVRPLPGDRLAPTDPRRSLAAWLAADVPAAGGDDLHRDGLDHANGRDREEGKGIRGVDPQRRTEQIATIVGQRVAQAFTGWFGEAPGRAPARFGRRLDQLSLGDAARKRLASTLAVTLAAGERGHLELRLLLTESGDALVATVLDCRRRETLERAGLIEVDIAMGSAVRAIASAARDAGFVRIAWSWAMRSAYPPVSFVADQELRLPPVLVPGR